MKTVHVVVEIIRDSEGNPGIHVFDNALKAAECVKALEAENNEIGIDDENVFVVSAEVRVE